MEHFKNINYKTFLEYENSLFNYQDKAIIRLIYENVELDEIANLIINDVDFTDSTLTLTSMDGRIRKIRVSEKCLEIIKRTNEETEYALNNGVQKDNLVKYVPLTNSGYVIRPAIPIFKNNSQKVSIKFIEKKIEIIKSYLGLNFYEPIDGYRLI